MKNKYQLEFESHSNTCKLCDEEYYAKGFCHKHYVEDYRKKWLEKNPNYDKNYGKTYYQKMKNNPKFKQKRNSYIKQCKENKQLAKESTSGSSATNTSDVTEREVSLW